MRWLKWTASWFQVFKHMEGEDPSCPRVPRVGELQRTSAPAVLYFHNSTHVGNLVCGYRLCCGFSACDLGARLGRPATILAPVWNFLVLGGLESELSLVLVLLLLPEPGGRHSLFPPDRPGWGRNPPPGPSSTWCWPGPSEQVPAAPSCANACGFWPSHCSVRPGWRTVCLCLERRRQSSQLP